MLAVVTGGAGHIGTNLALALRRAGHDVRVVDPREPASAVRAGAAWTPADVRDAAAVRTAFIGADVVYHLAGVISVVGGLHGLVESVNVEGTRTVAAAALRVGVPRLVHCSSVHAFDTTGVCVLDESSPRATGRRRPAYDRSKFAGEVEIYRAVDRGLDAVVVNPTGVIGPCDEQPSRMGAVLLALWRHRLPAVVPGGFDWVDVRDVVAAMMTAAGRGSTGQAYLLPGHRVSMRDLAEVAAGATGVAVTRRSAPMWAARLAGPAATAIARRTGYPVLPTSEALRALRGFPAVDGSRAARDLGLRPRPIAETIGDLYAYFLRAGRLPAPGGSDRPGGYRRPAGRDQPGDTSRPY